MEIARARKSYIRWLRATRDLSPHTTRAYDSDLRAFESHVGARAEVSTLDAETLIGFLESQRLAGLSHASVLRRAASLRGFFRWLKTGGRIASNPWLDVSVPRGRSRRLPRPVQTDNLDRLLRSLETAAGPHRAAVVALDDAFDANTLLAVALMVGTGVRVKEVVGIRCSDIDLGRRAIRILGKGGRERHVFLSNDWITDRTRRHLRVRASLGVDHARLLFNVRLAPLTEQTLRARLRKAAEKARLTEHVTPHMLRHSAATQLLEAGVDIRFVQRLLGHASLSTTEVYTHVSNHALRSVITEADVLGRVAQQR